MLLTATLATAAEPRPCRRIVGPLSYAATPTRDEPVRCWRRVPPLA